MGHPVADWLFRASWANDLMLCLRADSADDKELLVERQLH